MPYRFRSSRRQLTVAEAEAILKNVPSHVLGQKSTVNPAFTKQAAMRIFMGACLEYRKKGRGDDFIMGGPISNNILDEFGAYEDSGEHLSDAGQEAPW